MTISCCHYVDVDAGGGFPGVFWFLTVDFSKNRFGARVSVNSKDTARIKTRVVFFFFFTDQQMASFISRLI